MERNECMHLWKFHHCLEQTIHTLHASAPSASILSRPKFLLCQWPLLQLFSLRSSLLVRRSDVSYYEPTFARNWWSSKDMCQTQACMDMDVCSPLSHAHARCFYSLKADLVSHGQQQVVFWAYPIHVCWGSSRDIQIQPQATCLIWSEPANGFQLSQAADLPPKPLPLSAIICKLSPRSSPGLASKCRLSEWRYSLLFKIFIYFFVVFSRTIEVKCLTGCFLTCLKCPQHQFCTLIGARFHFRA